MLQAVLSCTEEEIVKRSCRLLPVLLIALLAAGGSVLAEDGNFGFDPPAGLVQNDSPVIRNLALKGPSELGPIEPPPILPLPPGAEVKPLGFTGSGSDTKFVAIPVGGSGGSTSVQNSSGIRLDSYMNEHRVSKRKLKATIKKLG